MDRGELVRGRLQRADRPGLCRLRNWLVPSGVPAAWAAWASVAIGVVSVIGMIAMPVVLDFLEGQAQTNQL